MWRCRRILWHRCALTKNETTSKNLARKYKSGLSLLHNYYRYCTKFNEGTDGIGKHDGGNTPGNADKVEGEFQLFLNGEDRDGVKEETEDVEGARGGRRCVEGFEFELVKYRDGSSREEKTECLENDQDLDENVAKKSPF